MLYQAKRPPSTPRLALFAARAVAEGEELCFDYGDPGRGEGGGGGEGGEGVEEGRTKCVCGSDQCKGFLPFDPDLL